MTDVRQRQADHEWLSRLELTVKPPPWPIVDRAGRYSSSTRIARGAPAATAAGN